MAGEKTCFILDDWAWTQDRSVWLGNCSSNYSLLVDLERDFQTWRELTSVIMGGGERESHGYIIPGESVGSPWGQFGSRNAPQ